MAQDTGGSPKAARPQRVSKRQCKMADCVNRVSGHDLCGTHLMRQKKGLPLDAPIRTSWKGKPCSIGTCDEPVKSRGWCGYHYLNWRRHGDAAWTPPLHVRPPCSAPDCPTATYAKGHCFKHYSRMWSKGTLETRPRRTPEELKATRRAAAQRRRERTIESGEICTAEHCRKPPRVRGLCDGHYQNLRKYGDPLAKRPLRPASATPFTYRLPALCEIDGCNERVRMVGYCAEHYDSYRKYGDPLAGGGPRRKTPPLPRSATSEERFWIKVDKDGPVSRARPDLGPCWIWQGGIDGNGYGLFTPRGWRRMSAHRYAWILAGESLIKGLTIDHLCVVTGCVRRSHLDQVTRAVNAMRNNSACARNARKTHCMRDHELTPENIRSYGRGRTCRICYNEWRRRRRATLRLASEDRRIANDYRRAVATDPCIYCGELADSIEHLFPVGKGGSDAWWNIARACKPCNYAKRDRCATWFVLRNGTAHQSPLFGLAKVAA